MNAIFETESPDCLYNEACGNFELGLTDAAENQIAYYETLFGADSRSIMLRKAIAANRGDYIAQADLARDNFEDSPCPINDLHAANIAGDHAWAYKNCLALQTHRCDPLYWFNRACFASMVGEFNDALMSLMTSFRISNRYHADAFLDPDLLPLWQWMGSVKLDDDTAESIVHWIWPTAVNSLFSTEAALTLTPPMRGMVPEHFRKFIPCGTMKHGLFPEASMPTALFHGYLAWQKETALRQAKLLQTAFDRAQEYVYRRQPAFACWQAKHGNPTAARYHILFYLSKYPENLPKLAYLRQFGMGYLLDELAPALAEDDQFAAVMHSAMQSQGLDTIREILDGIGQAGKQTTIFKLRLANLETQMGRSAQANRLLAEVVRNWPDDATGYSGLTQALISEGRWEEARITFNAAPSHYRRFLLYSDNWHQISSEDATAITPDRMPFDTFVGQRNLGGSLGDGWFLTGGDAR